MSKRSRQRQAQCTHAEHRALAIAALALTLSIVGGCSEDGEEDPPGTQDARRKALRLFVFPKEVEPLGESTLAIETAPCDGCFVCVRSGEKGRGRVLGAPGASLDTETGLVIVPAGESETLTSLVFRAPDREGSDVLAASLVQPDSDANPCQGSLVDTTTARVITRRPTPATGEEEPDASPPLPPPEAEDAGSPPGDASTGG